jgi:hypothetical protein
LVTVTVCGALVPPTSNVPKLTTAGLTVIDPAGIPFPVSGTVAAATPAEEDWIVNVPVRIPVVEGVSSTPVVQLAPAASVDKHRFPIRWKSPFTAMVSPARAACPELVTVRLSVAEAVLTTTLPNVS